MRWAGPDGPGLDREGGGRGSSRNLWDHAKRVLSFPLPLNPPPRSNTAIVSERSSSPHLATLFSSDPFQAHCWIGKCSGSARGSAPRRECVGGFRFSFGPRSAYKRPSACSVKCPITISSGTMATTHTTRIRLVSLLPSRLWSASPAYLQPVAESTRPRKAASTGISVLGVPARLNSYRRFAAAVVCGFTDCSVIVVRRLVSGFFDPYSARKCAGRSRRSTQYSPLWMKYCLGSKVPTRSTLAPVSGI